MSSAVVQLYTFHKASEQHMTKHLIISRHAFRRGCLPAGCQILAATCTAAAGEVALSNMPPKGRLGLAPRPCRGMPGGEGSTWERFSLHLNKAAAQKLSSQLRSGTPGTTLSTTFPLELVKASSGLLDLHRWSDNCMLVMKLPAYLQRELPRPLRCAVLSVGSTPVVSSRQQTTPNTGLQPSTI